jgi:hypothetical protein
MEMRDRYTSEFEGTLRNTVAVPQANPEFVMALWKQISESPVGEPVRADKQAFGFRFAQVMKKRFVPDRITLRRVGIIALVLLIVFAFFIATPVGRVVAERITHFFTHAAVNWKPIPAEYNLTAAPEQKPVETATLAPPVTGQTIPQFFSLAEPKRVKQGGTSDTLSHAAAASLVPYPLKEPQDLPDGYQFSYALFFPQNNNILLAYPYQPDPKGEMILLILSPAFIPDEVGPDAKVEKITVNGFEGEMVQGGWLALAGEDWETWESRLPVTTLRWFDGEIYIKIQFHLNETFSPAYLSLPQMLHVAESVRPAPESGLQLTPVPANTAFQEMEKQFGYNLLEPGFLPAGYELREVEQVPGRIQVDARYRPAASAETGPRLTISQIPLSVLPKVEPQDYPPDSVKIVDINGSPGRLMDAVDEGPDVYPSWFLFWETPDLAMSIWFYPGPNISAEDAKGMLIEIAKSMK